MLNDEYKITYANGMFHIDSDNIHYSLIEDMYESGHGEGCQLSHNIMKHELQSINLMCGGVYTALKSLDKKLKECGVIREE